MELFSTQKKIYQFVKKKVSSYEGPVPKELIEYKKKYNRLNQQSFSVIKTNIFLNKIRSSKVIYLGDFHTFEHASKNVERIIKYLTSDHHNLAIAIELVNTSKQNVLNNYLQNNITELEFLEEINYSESWRFPWKQYRSIINLAKLKKIPVLALNTNGSLKERDAHAAKILSEHIDRNPELKILVLYGELHILPDKIPYLLNNIIKNNGQVEIKQTIVHQNVDGVYWKLLKRKKNSDPLNCIVQFSKNEFSIQSSAPWAKYESMAYWYENIYDDPDFDLHEYIRSSVLERKGELNGPTPISEIIHDLTKNIGKILKLESLSDKGHPPIKNSELEIDILTNNHLSILEKKLDGIKPKTLANTYKKFLYNGITFKIPGVGIYYCPVLSSNRCASICGTHLFNLNDQYISTFEFYLSDPNKRKVAFFHIFFYQNIFAYLSSLIINPYRKCDLYLDIKELFNSNRKKIDPVKFGAYEFLLTILEKPRKAEKGLNKTNDLVVARCAIYLARIVAHGIYHHHIKKGLYPWSQWRTLPFPKELNSLDHISKILRESWPNSSLYKQRKVVF